MQIKKPFIKFISAGILLGCFIITAAAGAATRISIDSPDAEITLDENVSVEGYVVNPQDNYVKIKVEPFIEKKDYKTQDYIVPLAGDRFKKAVKIPAGISIITVSTLDERWTTEKAVLLFSTEKGLKEDSWGKSSPIHILEPADLRIKESPCMIRGRVTDRSLKNIEVVTVNLTEFQRLYLEKKESSLLNYKKVGVAGRTFSFQASLNEGINLIIARPEGNNAPELTQTKVLVYEGISPKISLLEPRINRNLLIVEGSIKDMSLKQIGIRVEALLKKEENSMPFLKVISENKVPVKGEGKFILNVALDKVQGLFDNSYFLISVSAGKEKVIRLIVKRELGG